jgi:hypothetical protein
MFHQPLAPFAQFRFVFRVARQVFQFVRVMIEV